jgi:hypothetical protein
VASKHKNGKADFDAFRTEAINAFDPAKHVEVPETKIGMSKKDRKQFSVRKLILELFTTGKLPGLRRKPAKPLANNSAKLATIPWTYREGFTLPEDMAVRTWPKTTISIGAA